MLLPVHLAGWLWFRVSMTSSSRWIILLEWLVIKRHNGMQMSSYEDIHRAGLKDF